jgi:hypothetical protein
MATLTSLGVNASDGSLNGQYTGTDSQYNSYPIGSILFTGTVVIGASAPITYVNSSFPYVKYRTTADFLRAFFVASSTASVAGWANLSGTWRLRGGAGYGGCCGNTIGGVIQRVA